MKKSERDVIQEILKADPITTTVPITPDIIKAGVSESIRDMVEKIAEFNWTYHATKHGLAAYGCSHPDQVFRRNEWRGWIDLMGYDRVLYEFEAVKKLCDNAPHFLIIGKASELISDFYAATYRHFISVDFPLVWVIKQEGNLFQHIYGSLNDDMPSNEELKEILRDHQNGMQFDFSEN